jgi:AAA15 family ATPase/GTPase
MLIEFRFKNYACFKDEQVLSLVASSDRSHEENMIESAAGMNFNLLRSLIVYGANASGKTKLLEALTFVRDFVEGSVNRNPNDPTGTLPFRLDEKTASEPSDFEITFIHKKVRYQYGFSVDRNRVHQEYLFAAPRGRLVQYFERQFDPDSGKEDFNFGASLKGPNEKIRDLTRPNALFLSTAATFNHPQLSGVYQWFSDQMLAVDIPRVKIDLTLRGNVPDVKYHGQLKKLLNFADLGITDFQYKKETGYGEYVGESGSRTLQPVNLSRIEFIHSNADNVPVSFPIDIESAGTEQFFFLSTVLIEALSKGKVTLIDEIDSSLHPLLVRALIELFHRWDSNSNNAQLVFNSHDTTLLDNTLFRRDQVWFTEKDPEGAAHIYSLLEYSPRKGESLAKGYLQGRYGAIPLLGDASILFAGEPINAAA